MGENGLTSGTWVFARRLEVVTVAGLLWIQWCVLGGADFSVISISLHFLIHSNTQSSQRRIGVGAPPASHSANKELPPTDPHQVYRLVCSQLRNLSSAVDQYSSLQPASLIFDPTSEFNLDNFPSSFESASRSCSRERTLR